ncbi:hypothetical protein [Streptosporangium sp. CA-115845]|uniref:hypothetical protein n=1 Tax=Streptosporangium sp. CA-115845 TaxID=3240071 RepID=UPI003D8F5610
MRVNKLVAAAAGGIILLAISTAGASPVLAQRSTDNLPASSAVTCGSSRPPGGYYYDSTYANPNACLKCQSAGAFYEATGKWRAYCRRVNNSNGAVAWADLHLFCVACRSVGTSSHINGVRPSAESA